MIQKIKTINETISNIEGVAVHESFIQKDEKICGKIRVTQESVTLIFDVQILPQYPFQIQGSEAIRFINIDLIDYNHVMGGGSICIHTTHNPDLIEKLKLDINSLKEWIDIYYINNGSDEHYEHIIVPDSVIGGSRSVLLFTEVDFKFNKGEFGYFTYSHLANGIGTDSTYNTYIVQGFEINNHEFETKWSKYYKAFKKNRGIFVFIDEPPVEKKRFAISNWSQLGDFLDEDSLRFIYNIGRENKASKDKANSIPLMLGYYVNKDEVHWQAIQLSLIDFPVYGEKSEIKGKYIGRLKDKSIEWMQTKNSSYEYFFGRGTLSESITNGNILIIGIGAIGSMIANTLVRGGCKKMTLVDYDIKEPENVCRSEYNFSTGISSKTVDLSIQLSNISPFVDIIRNELLMDVAKVFSDKDEWKKVFKNHLEQFDFIIDCTADNDVAYILDKVDIKGKIMSISVTNHSKDLICVFNPDLYRWLNDIFTNTHQNLEDLYNPTGCWNPTFKASYNDISVLVQYALKHINNSICQNILLRNFRLSTDIHDGFNIKLEQF